MLACLQPVNDEVASGSRMTKGWRVPVTIASSPKRPVQQKRGRTSLRWGEGITLAKPLACKRGRCDHSKLPSRLREGAGEGRAAGEWKNIEGRCPPLTPPASGRGTKSAP
jgi:hypothetical protein